MDHDRGQPVYTLKIASGLVGISRNTGPIRHLRERVAEAERRGAIAYIPSIRGRPPEESLVDWEG